MWLMAGVRSQQLDGWVITIALSVLCRGFSTTRYFFSIIGHKFNLKCEREILYFRTSRLHSIIRFLLLREKYTKRRKGIPFFSLSLITQATPLRLFLLGFFKVDTIIHWCKWLWVLVTLLTLMLNSSFQILIISGFILSGKCCCHFVANIHGISTKFSYSSNLGYAV